VLGFDVMFDHQLRPFLIEVNHSPSFTCDSPLDTTVKSAVLKATMEMVSNPNPNPHPNPHPHPHPNQGDHGDGL